MGIKGFFCIQCVCKDTYTGYPVLTTEPVPEVCDVEELKLGDGVCDPEAAGSYSCDYDAGDCSGTGFKSSISI